MSEVGCNGAMDGEDIPAIGDDDAQARLDAIWKACGDDERGAIRSAWFDACSYNERDRFRRAVMDGKDALLAVEDEIQEESGGRFSLYDLFWDVEKLDDPDGMACRLMAAMDGLRGPQRDRIIPLLRDREREMIDGVLGEHEDVVRWLLLERPNPDELPCSELLRDLGCEACSAVWGAINAVWEHLGAIEIVLSDGTPPLVREAVTAVVAFENSCTSWPADWASPPLARLLRAIAPADPASRLRRLDALLATLRTQVEERKGRREDGAIPLCVKAIEAVERLAADPAAVLPSGPGSDHGEATTKPAPPQTCPACGRRIPSHPARRG